MTVCNSKNVLLACFVLNFRIIILHSKCEDRTSCGERPLFPRRRGQYVYNGGKARLGEYPWQLIFREKGKEGSILCGGIIIHRSWILIAAHCLKDGGRDAISMHKRVVVAGLVDRANDQEKSDRRQIRTIVGIIDFFDGFHKDIDTHRDDIALLKVQYPFKFNKYVQPICIARKEERFINKTCVASGWGISETSHGKATQILRDVKLRIISRVECYLLVKKQHPNFSPMGRNFLCAIGPADKRRSTCTGDSGGPFMCKRRDGRFVLAGINKGIYKCGENPSTFSKVSYYYPWIVKETGLRYW